jgi:hypothetical protein
VSLSIPSLNANLTSVFSFGREKEPDFTTPVQLEFFEFSTGAPHPLATTHTVSLPLLSEFPDARVNAEVLGDHILITVWNRTCKALVFLVSWKTGIVTLVSGFSKFCLILNSHEICEASYVTR